MPAGNRIRGNNSFGVTTDAPLTAGATTFNSAGLATLPTVSAAHAVIVLDPKRLNGEPEIVVVTSHTALATVATITRGQYGTVARSHPTGTPWAHVPVDEDYIEVLTSGTRPSNPYEGQFIYETDTNKLVGFGGVDWAPRDAGGQLGYGQMSIGQNGIASVETDVTGCTTTVTVGTGRVIKITGFVPFQQVGSAGLAEIRIKEGTNTLMRTFSNALAAEFTYRMPVVRLTPSAGVHTYKLAAITPAGTLNTFFSPTDTPSFILVEDIGAA